MVSCWVSSKLSVSASTATSTRVGARFSATTAAPALPLPSAAPKLVASPLKPLADAGHCADDCAAAFSAELCSRRQRRLQGESR